MKKLIFWEAVMTFISLVVFFGLLKLSLTDNPVIAAVVAGVALYIVGAFVAPPIYSQIYSQTTDLTVSAAANVATVAAFTALAIAGIVTNTALITTTVAVAAAVAVVAIVAVAIIVGVAATSDNFPPAPTKWVIISLLAEGLIICGIMTITILTISPNLKY